MPVMDIAAIVAELENERDQIDRAIAALHGSATKKKPGPKPGRRVMSADARRRIGLAMKKRWAARKKAA